MSELLPPRKIKRTISLTPLVDVIFLLLIFFMLTSQIAPFSIISFAGTKVDRNAQNIDLPSLTEPSSPGLGSLITVLNGGVLIDGQRTTHLNIDKAMADLLKSGVTTAIISPRSTASVQDLITVLEAVKKASFVTIRIRNSR